MKKTTRKWIHGLVATFIGGGASSVTSGFTANMLAPNSFNFGNELGRTLLLMVITFGINGFFSAMFYLKQSPVPPDDDDATTQEKANAATP